MQAAKEALESSTFDLKDAFQKAEEVRVHSVESLFEVILSEGLAQWGGYADGFENVRDGKSGLGNKRDSSGNLSVASSSEDGGIVGGAISPTARVSAPRAPPPAAAPPPMPIVPTVGDGDDNGDIKKDLIDVSLDSPASAPASAPVPAPAPAAATPLKNATEVIFKPPPMLSARKSLGGDERPSFSSEPIPEAKTRSLEERSRSIGSVGSIHDSGRPSSTSTSGRSAGMGSISEDERPSSQTLHMALKPKTKYGDDVTDMLREAQIKNEQEVNEEFALKDEERKEEEQLDR